MPNALTFLRSTILVGLFLLLMACGRQHDTATAASLLLHVSYPSPNANVGGVKVTSVTGYIEKSDGSEVFVNDIDYVNVNGQIAEIEWPVEGAADNIVRWRTQLSLVEGTVSTLMIEMADTTNNIQQVTQVLTNRPLLRDMESIALDIDNNRALVVGSTLSGLSSIALDSGERIILSDEHIGSGINLSSPRGIALDAANNRALVVDSDLDALLAIDLETGERTIISDDSVGSGINLALPVAIAVDSTSNRVWILDSLLNALVVVNLETGDRRIATDDFNTLIGGIAMDFTNNRALVIDSGLDALVSIDLNTFRRSIVPEQNIVSGINLIAPQGIVLDSTNNRALLVDSELDALVEIDLDTGKRAIVSCDGTDTAFATPQDITLDNVNNRVWVVDSELDRLLAIELKSG